jgi:hypothetical protein
MPSKISIFLALIFLPILIASGQENLNIRENSDSLKKKPEFVFQIDQRNSFIRSQAVSINGLLFGLDYRGKNQYSIGIYTLSPWNKPLPQMVNDSVTEDKKFNLYFLSFGYTPTLFRIKKFKITLPVEIGFGYAYAKVDRYLNNHEYKAKKSTDFIPAQIGIFLDYKVAKWGSLVGSVGYRKLILERLFAAKVNYNGFYFNFGLNLYFDQVGSILKVWRTKAKNNQELSETKSKLSIRSGYSLAKMRDSYISSFLYNSGVIPVNIQFSHIARKNYQTLQLNLNAVLFTTKTNKGFEYTTLSGAPIYPSKIHGLDQTTVRNTIYNVSYSYGQKIGSLRSIDFYAGAELNYTFQNKYFLVLKYYNNTREQFYSANAFFFTQYNWSKKDKISYSFSIPFYSYIYNDHFINNSPYDRSGTSASFGHYLALNSSIDYSFKITAALALDVKYTFYYYQYKNIIQEQLSTQTLMIGGSYNF